MPRERVRGLSALRLVERSGTEITVVTRRPRQRALRNVPRQPEQYPYDAPTWEVSDSEGHVLIVELTSQDDRQQSFFGRVKGEENTERRWLRTSPRRRPRRLPCYDHPALPRVIGGL